MLRVDYIRDNKDKVAADLLKRNFNPDQITILDEILQLDDKRKLTQKSMDDLRSEANALDKEIGVLYKSGKAEAASAIKEKSAGIKNEAKSLEEQLAQTKSDLTQKLLTVPNAMHPSVPAGKGEEDNELYQAYDGALPEMPEDSLAHWDLAKQYNIIDFELGAKITGSGFPLYRGKGAKLQRALISFFLEEAIAGGYEEVMPPLLVNEDTARATGQLPDKEGQMYYINEDDLYLIPTAEVPITNIHRGDILSPDQLPVKLTGFTPCFRREAGSHGKDVRGLNRVHQFEKVEIVRIEHPDNSYDALQDMLKHIGGLLNKLELPYRILRLCGADIGFTSALTFDFEVYAAAQKKWLEVSSASNFETFQANRLNLRIKDASGGKILAHTLNGSALALARIVATLMENNQTAEGIRIPKALQPYTGFDIIN